MLISQRDLWFTASSTWIGTRFTASSFQSILGLQNILCLLKSSCLQNIQLVSAPSLCRASVFAKYLLWVQHSGFAEHLMFAEHPVLMTLVSQLEAAGWGWGLLTTLQPAQSGPFSQVLRRAWMPPPHWAVHRSQGPHPVQNTCGGHSRCSLQYL